MNRTIAFLLLICVTPLLSRAQLTMSVPVKISANAGAHSPALHVGQDGTIYASWFERSADIYFSHSTNGGKSFSVPVRASRQVTTNNYTSLLQRAPEFAIDTKSRIHLVWTEARAGSQTDVWYIRSTDQGATWTQPMSIMDADDSQKYSQDFSAIACDSSDNLYVSYLDNRWLMRNGAYGTNYPDHYRLHMQRSANGGMTWSTAVIADKLPVFSSGTCECCRQDIAASRDGHVYIAFRTSQDLTSTLDDRSIFICRSLDQGMTWERSIRCQLGTWNLTACPTKGPHIALDKNENLFVAWNDARDDSARLATYIGLLRRGDSQVFPNLAMSNNSATWPTVAVNPSGLLAYAFMPSDGQIQFTYSSDGGNSWNRDRSLPGKSSDDQSLPSVEFNATGHALAVWQDADSNGILFTEIGGLTSPAQLPPVVSLIPSNIGPAGAMVLRWHKPAIAGTSTFVWYMVDVKGLTNGPVMTRDTELIAPPLPVGVYNYTIKAYSTFDSSTTVGSITVANAEVVAEKALRPREFPNPVLGNLATFEIPELMGSADVSITNETGTTIKHLRSQALNGRIILSVSDLPVGNYHVTISSDSLRWTFAIVKR